MTEPSKIPVEPLTRRERDRLALLADRALYTAKDSGCDQGALFAQ